MNIEPTNLFRIRQLGLEVLSRELGPVAMIRFLQQYETSTGDYLKERHQWLNKLAVDDISEKARIFRDRTAQQTSTPDAKSWGFCGANPPAT